MTITLGVIADVIAYIYVFVHIILALTSKDDVKEIKHLIWAIVIMLTMISGKTLME